VANAVVFFARMDTFVRWRGGGCGKNGGSDILALAACKSRQWTARREREGGGGGCSDEALAMLPRGGRAADDTTRGVGAEGAAQGELEADDSTIRGGCYLWKDMEISNLEEGHALNSWLIGL